jgi:uncharacterized membrane protein
LVLSQLTLATSYFFHLLATVVWLGGLAVLTLMVQPAARRTLQEHPAFYAFMTRLRKRFVPFANFSLVLLAVTGLFQQSLDPNYLGVLDFGNSWSVALLLKHVAFFGMVICSVTIQYAVAPALERTSLLLERGKGDPADWERLSRREQALTWLNNGLGGLVLVFTAWMTAI